MTDITKNSVHWFEIPVLDMDRAKAFYEKVFDLEIAVTQMGEDLCGWFPSYPNEPGSSGSLIKGKSYTPSHSGTLVYFSVKEILDITGKVEGIGGKILSPKFSIGEHGYCAVLEDTEGNRLGIHQSIKSN